MKHVKAFLIGFVAALSVGFGIPGPQGSASGSAFSGGTGSPVDSLVLDVANGDVRLSRSASAALLLDDPNAGGTDPAIVFYDSTETSTTGRIQYDPDNNDVPAFVFTDGTAEGSAAIFVEWIAHFGTNDRSGYGVCPWAINGSSGYSASGTDIGYLWTAGTDAWAEVPEFGFVRGASDVAKLAGWVSGQGFVEDAVFSTATIAPLNSTTGTLVLRDQSGSAALTVGTTGALTVAGNVNFGGAAQTTSGNLRVDPASEVVAYNSQVQAASNTLSGISDNTATTLLTVALPGTLTACGGTITVTVRASDGTDMQTATDVIQFAATNKAGTLTVNARLTDSDSGSGGAVAVTTGAWTSRGYSATASGTNVLIQGTWDSSLTVTTMVATYHVVLNADPAVATITLP